MKNLVFIFTVIVVLSFFVIANKKFENKEEIRAMYISYIELNSYIKDKTEKDSKNNICKMLDNIKNLNFNGIIVHVRPFSDSIYKSDYYPISNTVLNHDKEPSYDVLEYFINESHKRGISFHAWINPYRISNVTDLKDIPNGSPFYKMTSETKILDNGIYLNPASQKVQTLIINGIKEIVRNYDVDGIHFDDYFYPDKTIDLDTYKKSNSKTSIDDYRRDIISSLLKNTYSEIKKIKKNVLFGIAPEGNIENDFNNSYLDLNEILSSNEYLDYIMPQIYYGFLNERKPFLETVAVWNEMIKNKSISLIPALAFYKVGKEDEYALSGKNEWIDKNDIIKRQITVSRNTSNYKGFSLFRYDYLFSSLKSNSNIEKELNNLKSIIK